MKLIAVLISCFAVAFAENEECRDAFRYYAGCIETKQAGLAATVIATGQIKLDDIKTCFSSDSEGVECEFPDLDFSTPPRPPRLSAATVTCVRKELWKSRVDELFACAAGTSPFIVEAMKDVPPVESVLREANFLKNLHRMKKAMMICRENGIDIDHWTSIKNCVKTKINGHMAEQKEKRCDINQDCFTAAFNDHRSCIPGLVQSKPELCRCWIDELEPKIVRNFELLAQPFHWNDEEKLEMACQMRPFLQTCQAEDMGAGRHRRNYRSRRDLAAPADQEPQTEISKPEPIFCQCVATLPAADTW